MSRTKSKGMIYIFKVFNAGKLIVSREVRGMVEIDKLLAVYPETDYEVEWYPDAYRYMELNCSPALS